METCVFLRNTTNHGILAHVVTLKDDYYLLKAGTGGKEVTLRFDMAESRETFAAMRTFLEAHGIAEIEESKTQTDIVEVVPFNERGVREINWGEMTF